MADKKRIPRFATIVVCVVIGVVLICWGLSEQERRSVLDYILTVIGFIITAATFIQSILKIDSKKHNENKNQEGDSPEDDVNRGNEKWWSHNWKRLMAVAVFSVLVVVGLAVHHNNKENSIQRCFDTLVAGYNHRMDELLTYEKACPSINDDFDLLLKILQMLNEHPNLNAAPKIQYIGQFKNRADTAIAIIRNAIYSTHLTESMRDEMFLKYTPCIDSIEKSIDSIEKIRNSL